MSFLETGQMNKVIFEMFVNIISCISTFKGCLFCIEFLAAAAQAIGLLAWRIGGSIWRLALMTRRRPSCGRQAQSRSVRLVEISVDDCEVAGSLWCTWDHTG
jgi:hypothetical protein